MMKLSPSSFRIGLRDPIPLGQGDQGDFAGAVEPQGDAGGAGAPAGVAGHLLILPCAGSGITRGPGVGEDGALIRQADLSAVGVAAEVETGVALGCFFVCLRRVGEEDGEGLRRDIPKGGFGVGHFVEMRIIDADDPDPFSVALYRPGFVNKHDQAGLLKIRGHFQAVMVAKYSQDAVL